MATERPFASLRRSIGMSLERAAARLLLSPAYLRGLELGHYHLSYALSRRMAATYGVAVAQLVRAAGPAARSRAEGPGNPSARYACGQRKDGESA